MSPKDAATLARKIADEMKGNWDVVPMGKESRDFIFRKPKGTKNPTASKCWDLTYQLQQHRDVAECAPSVFMPVNGMAEMQSKREQAQASRYAAASSSSSGSGGGGGPDAGGLACSTSKTWSLDATKVQDAWTLTPVSYTHLTLPTIYSV